MMGIKGSRTVSVCIYHKDPDAWGEVIDRLDLSEARRRKFFEFGEYATLELEIDEDLRIVGRVVPR